MAECVWGSRLYHSGRAHAFWSWVRIPPGAGLPSSSFLFLTLKLGKCKSGVKFSTSEFLDTQIFSSFKRMGDSKFSKWCVLIYPNWHWQCHLSQLWKSSNFAFQKAVLSLVQTKFHWHYWLHHCYYVNGGGLKIGKVSLHSGLMLRSKFFGAEDLNWLPL